MQVGSTIYYQQPYEGLYGKTFTHLNPVEKPFCRHVRYARFPFARTEAQMVKEPSQRFLRNKLRIATSYLQLSLLDSAVQAWRVQRYDVDP